VQEATQSIDSSGGMVTVSKTGDPIDGFILDVPPSSYSGSTTFNISSAPITNQTFGSDIDPISPMIYVDNGGAVSNDLMYIRVPVTVPVGYFAMGFIYDATTKQLEGMSLLSADSDSVTVGTTHFSNFFISMISKTLLQTDIDSGFRPGIDDWQFPNYGSYITTNGNCEGQSLSAMWYYYNQPDGKDLCLYGRYDNNGNQPATPSFWQDDSLAIRFCSVIQSDPGDTLNFVNKLWNNLGGINWIKQNNTWKIVEVPGLSDESTWDLFAYSIQATHEPQLVVIWSKDGSGHAMIVYRIYQGNLYIADPNYPGNTERRIQYTDGKLQSYNAGANKADIDAGNGKEFDIIQYYAKSTVLPWDKIAERWAEFKDGTIGDAQFPDYQMNLIDDQGHNHELTDGYVSTDKLFKFHVTTTISSVGWAIYRDGVQLHPDADINYELNPGNNQLGILVHGSGDINSKFIDFKYLNIIYDAPSSTTTTTPTSTTPVSTGAPSVLQQLQSNKYFMCNVNFVWAGQYGPANDALSVHSTITWQGTGFAGSSNVSGVQITIQGTMSADGNTLVQLKAIYQSSNQQETLELSNVPISSILDFKASGTDAQKYVTKLEDLQSINGQLTPKTITQIVAINGTFDENGKRFGLGDGAP